jgi:hypothetical protein
MIKPAVNHDKAHKSPQWRAGARPPRAGVPRPESRRRAAGAPAGRPGAGPRRVPRRPPGGGDSLLCGKSLNWTLRRYVRASSLRVWLRRHRPEAIGEPVPRAAGAPPGRPPAPRDASGRTAGERPAVARRQAARRVTARRPRAAAPAGQKPTNRTLSPAGRPAFEEVFDTVRLSLYESAPPPGTWY